MLQKKRWAEAHLTHSLTLVALLPYAPACTSPDLELELQLDVKLVLDPFADRLDKPLYIAAPAAFVSDYKVGVFFAYDSPSYLKTLKAAAVYLVPSLYTVI